MGWEDKLMRFLTRSLGISALTAAVIFGGILDASAQTKKRPVIRKKAPVARKPAVPAARLYTVPAGKRIRVRMNETLSSKTARVGDRFTVTVREPVYSSTGVVVIPEGSELIGR